MPEIGEVARVVSYLRKHLVGRTIARITAEDDAIVYGKVGTSAAAFQKSLTGKKVVGAKQQGKYFWLEMASPPHPLMHLGMTGWVKFSNDDAAYYKPSKGNDEWPPKYLKFMLHLEGKPECEVAFVDGRRLARIRLVDVAANEMRKTTPLKENGPDPVIDKDIVTLEWFTQKMRSRRVPVKAFLLNQANLSGVGNWVADEVLYQARIHPEQYSNTFIDEQMKALHDALIFVCTTACETLADSSQFPKDWLMKHRWGKGKKEAHYLPNGDKITHITVGGRTSAFVPTRQIKTGDVAGGAVIEANESSAAESAVDEEESKPKRGKGRSKAPPKGKKNGVANGDENVTEPMPKQGKAKSKAAGKSRKSDEGNEPQPKKATKQGRGRASPAKKSTVKEEAAEEAEENGGVESDEPIKKGRARKTKTKEIKSEEDSDMKATPKSKSRKRSASIKNDVDAGQEESKPAKKPKVTKQTTTTSTAGSTKRRSARLSN